MPKVVLDEILGLERYEQSRDQFRRRIIDLKKQRRVSVGDQVTLVFENHDTMLFQVQEMVRAEHITDLDKVRDEIVAHLHALKDPQTGEIAEIHVTCDADTLSGPPQDGRKVEGTVAASADSVTVQAAPTARLVTPRFAISSMSRSV